jgi:hypothetical protein
VREVEDILLCKCNGGNSGSGGRAACAKRSEREQSREMAYKVQVLIKLLKNQPLLIMGVTGLDSSSSSSYYYSSSIYIINIRDIPLIYKKS